jgi:uncharacterized membrane protein
LYAIALTLLVVGIDVPNIPDTDSVRELADALDDNLSAYVSFFISFAVIGRYWLAHHRFFALLACVDTSFIALNLCTLHLSPSCLSRRRCSAGTSRTRSH